MSRKMNTDFVVSFPREKHQYRTIATNIGFICLLFDGEHKKRKEKKNDFLFKNFMPAGDFVVIVFVRNYYSTQYFDCPLNKLFIQRRLQTSTPLNSEPELYGNDKLLFTEFVLYCAPPPLFYLYFFFSLGANLINFRQ